MDQETITKLRQLFVEAMREEYDLHPEKYRDHNATLSKKDPRETDKHPYQRSF